MCVLQLSKGCESSEDGWRQPLETVVRKQPGNTRIRLRITRRKVWRKNTPQKTEVTQVLKRAKTLKSNKAVTQDFNMQVLQAAQVGQSPEEERRDSLHVVASQVTAMQLNVVSNKFGQPTCVANQLTDSGAADSQSRGPHAAL
jgi:hypothetical protein